MPRAYPKKGVDNGRSEPPSFNELAFDRDPGQSCTEATKGVAVSEADAAHDGSPVPEPGGPADTAGVEALVRRIWTSRCRWSEAANRVRDGVRFWRLAQLVLAVIGSVLAAAAATSLPEASGYAETAARAAALFGAIALALVGFVQIHFLPSESVESWARLRSVSEGLKSEVYRFRAGAKPYQSDQNGTLLARHSAELEQSAGDLAQHLPDEPAKPSDPPPSLTPATYLEKRVDQQIRDYYLPQSRKNKRLAGRYRYLGTAAAALGVVLSTVMAIQGAAEVGIWVPVLATLAAAFAAHAAVERYEFNANSYAQHAQRLETLARSWQANPSRFAPAVWSDFVHECEETISVENRGWMADMLRKVEGVSDIVAKARTEAGR